MEKKFTYINAIDNALNGVLDQETVDKLNALKVSLSKKSAKSGEKKATLTMSLSRHVSLRFLRTVASLSPR